MKPVAKVLIEVSGGVVQRVAADKRIQVYLVDHDDLGAGALPDEVPKPYTASLVRNVEREVQVALRSYRKAGH